MTDHREDTRLGELYQQLPKEDMPQPLVRQLMAAAEAQARQNAETAAASRLTARLQRWWRQQPLLAGSGIFAGALLVLVAVLRLMPDEAPTGPRPLAEAEPVKPPATAEAEPAARPLRAAPVEPAAPAPGGVRMAEVEGAGSAPARTVIRAPVEDSAEPRLAAATPAAAEPPPEVWMARIRQLQASGQTGEAGEELVKLRKQHPTLVLPKDLKALETMEKRVKSP